MIFMSMAMSVIYILIGGMFIFTNGFKEKLPDNREVIGGVFLAYGLFRFISGVQKLRKFRSEDV